MGLQALRAEAVSVFETPVAGMWWAITVWWMTKFGFLAHSVPLTQLFPTSCERGIVSTTSQTNGWCWAKLSPFSGRTISGFIEQNMAHGSLSPWEQVQEASAGSVHRRCSTQSRAKSLEDYNLYTAVIIDPQLGLFTGQLLPRFLKYMEIPLSLSRNRGGGVISQNFRVHSSCVSGAQVCSHPPFPFCLSSKSHAIFWWAQWLFFLPLP